MGGQISQTFALLHNAINMYIKPHIFPLASLHGCSTAAVKRDGRYRFVNRSLWADVLIPGQDHLNSF